MSQDNALLFVEKNELYADAFKETGVLGSVVAMVGDLARLKKMVIRNPEHGRDVRKNVEDKLRDISVQAIMGLMMLSEDNYDGI